MLSPTHPVRFMISYNGRKIIRTIHDAVHCSSFAKKRNKNILAFPVKKEQSPIFRNFNGVRSQLFVNKITNLRLALEKINHIIIEPGKTFSFWNLVGKPSADKGYLEGLVIERGRAKEGVGGGLCQLANMIHWLALHSELEVVERHRHSFDIFPDDCRTVPFGSGATIVYNYRDLRLLNRSGHAYQFVFTLTDDFLSGELRASQNPAFEYKIIERNHAFINMQDGMYRKNTLYRQKIDKKSGAKGESFVLHNYCLCRYDEASL